MGVSTLKNILVGALGYSWEIHGIFVGYSWHIHMYRVCIGNVSGMYRESVERYNERGGSHGRARMDTETRIHNLLLAPLEKSKPSQLKRIHLV